nr:MAG TPA: hypothetical protein [Caudoviricetes sp.]
MELSGLHLNFLEVLTNQAAIKPLRRKGFQTT